MCDLHCASGFTLATQMVQADRYNFATCLPVEVSASCEVRLLHGLAWLEEDNLCPSAGTSLSSLLPLLLPALLCRAAAMHKAGACSGECPAPAYKLHADAAALELTA
jgi:hypothetical protein